ncbi:hypothetical protein BH09SUM1_BH09SUM1_18660 [soil metagenome]
MTPHPVFLTAWSCIDESGFRGSAWPTRGEFSSAEHLRTFRWKEISEAPLERFPRMDSLSRVCVAAAEMLGGHSAEEGRRALVLGTASGSERADFQYERQRFSAGASPLLFSTTLPNIAAGEAAIRKRIKGPTLCILNDEAASAHALFEAITLIADGLADECIAIIAEAPADSPERAVAFLFSAQEKPGRYSVRITKDPAANPVSPQPIREAITALEAGANCRVDAPSSWGVPAILDLVQ